MFLNATRGWLDSNHVSNRCWLCRQSISSFSMGLRLNDWSFFSSSIFRFYIQEPDAVFAYDMFRYTSNLHTDRFTCCRYYGWDIRYRQQILLIHRGLCWILHVILHLLVDPNTDCNEVPIDTRGHSCSHYRSFCTDLHLSDEQIYSNRIRSCSHKNRTTLRSRDNTFDTTHTSHDFHQQVSVWRMAVTKGTKELLHRSIEQGGNDGAK